MKEIEEQPNDYFCGPSSLKQVLREQGVDANVYQIAQKAGTTYKLGTGHRGLAEAARYYGMKVRAIENSTIEQLQEYKDKGYSIILNYMDATPDGKFDIYNDGHYAVYAASNENTVVVKDPSTGNLEIFDREVFEKLWFDLDNDRLIWNWVLVIKKK